MPEYGKFRIGDLFEHIVQGRRLKKEDHIPGDFPFVMSGVTNTGLVAKIANPINRFPANSITIDIFGNTFYRSYEYSASDDVGVYWSDKNLSREVLLFICSVIQNNLVGKYNYSKKLRASQSLDFMVLLPVNVKGEIDFAYMEKYIHELEAARIHELEAARIRELEAYLKVTGLSNYKLTNKDLQFMQGGMKIKYKFFRIDDLFESQYGDFDIQQNHINGKGLLVVSSGETNLGIIGRSDVNAKVFSAGTITVDMFGYVYYRGHDYKLVTHARVFSLSQKTKKHLTREIGMYFVAQFGFFRNIFSYNDMASWKKIKDIEIKLPITVDGNPDYEYMTRFIRIQQKLAIKNVAEWKDRELEAYRTVTAK
jgi:hypothetical protein